MITQESQRQWLQQHLQQRMPNTFAHQPSWLKQSRAQAHKAITESAVLNRKQEAWRYTSIENLLKQHFKYVAEPMLSTPGLQNRKLQTHHVANLDAYRVVVIDGFYEPQLSDIRNLPEGVSVKSLRHVLKTDPEYLATWFGKTAPHPEHVFSALNTALTNDGVFLHVDKQVELDRPIEVVYLATDDDHSLLLQPRNLFVLEDGANATLVERFVSDKDAMYFQNHLTDITLGQDATLRHYRMQNESTQAYHLSSIYLSQQAHSHYYSTTLAFGAVWSRTEYQATFKQAGAECELNGLYMVGDKQLTDIHLDVRHSVPDCVSRERFKGVLYGKGRAVFDGHIRVDKKAQHSDAQLNNDNLLLTRDAEIDSKPQLEIYADDVKCSHGTTVGELDAQQIFYLRSRGIDESTARRMLCLGFAKDIVETIHLPALQQDAILKLSELLSGTVFVKD
jgi:Fe-S cluster assembly protein SufD